MFESKCNEIIFPFNKKSNFYWKLFVIISLLGFSFGLYSLYITLTNGIGTWGNNNNIAWGFAITNFVWWIGIGHAGTFISAILLIFRQEWRISISRIAEATTIFAIICATLFPVFHLGRPWLFYWVFPLGNNFGPLWINFNSPLTWDAIAIITYFTVSLIFFYLGLIPDLALIGKIKNSKFFKTLSLGWSNSTIQWKNLNYALLLLASIATPLVISVHSIVSLDFAVSIKAGWKSTIFPIYFVFGAIFSGFAMVQLIILFVRKLLNLKNYISEFHIKKVNLMLLYFSLIIGFCYFIEIFEGLISSDENLKNVLINKINGHYSFIFILMVVFNFVLPQFFWIKKLQTNILFSVFVSLCILIGMWLERFYIIVNTLSYSDLSNNFTPFCPTIIDIGLMIGSLGFFFLLFLLFIRYFPVITIYEQKTIK